MTAWQKADGGAVNSKVFAYVATVEREQFTIFERFIRLACLYDPNDFLVRHSGHAATNPRSDVTSATVTENVVASTIDTVVAATAATDVRARFLTDDADWSEQRRARHLEWYSEGLAKKLSVPEITRQCFKDAALKGVGLVKVYADPDLATIELERVLVDDIVVDEQECRGGKPRQMHQRIFADRETLAAQFPEHEERIRKGGAGSMGRRVWAGYRHYNEHEIVVIESWYLPIGVKGGRYYKPGRHTICIDGADLLDEEWHRQDFPFARIAWSERIQGWYAISLAERLAGHQRQLNKANWQIDRQLDQLAVPTTYVGMADANLAVRSVNRVGTIVPIKGPPPTTVIPQAVSGETYARREAIRASAFEESGISRLAATASKPGGLDSGVALREYRDQTTQRFAIQEKAFERFYLDIVLLALGAAKELGAAAPVIVKKSRFGRRRIAWNEVDLGDCLAQIAAASTISRTPAGRTQSVLEWAQAGLISQDEARRLMRHPDLERAVSLYAAAIEDIEMTIEHILDGAIIVPEPYQHLKMGVVRFQQAYLKARQDGAPEDVLEALRQWMVQATYLIRRGEGVAQIVPDLVANDEQQPMVTPGVAA